MILLRLFLQVGARVLVTVVSFCVLQVMYCGVHESKIVINLMKLNIVQHRATGDIGLNEYDDLHCVEIEPIRMLYSTYRINLLR